MGSEVRVEGGGRESPRTIKTLTNEYAYMKRLARMGVSAGIRGAAHFRGKNERR